ncbi:class I SAM-dependent methyltransferase [Lacticaseibacillus mingshuiensis]|uniref:Class I SAM-dependent methyltransferase n=1 Tax=Lacticaseibacillus mingshuiensis TaxID=2799574 RepID=A0ABW4CGR0_9LACO|nr:methyltransferase [Lacticaseibacillus mingshuiensis]
MQFTYHQTTLNFETLPTVFSPTALDRGTQAMLDLAPVQDGSRILDLGCGAGFVGIYFAKTLPAAQVTMVDVQEDAVAVATANAARNGVAPRILKSDGFSALGGEVFDVVLSNPPYHTDFSVAKGFIEGAYRQLAVGGTLYMVTKRRLWYENKIRAVFGGLRVVERDGYFVFIAEKRQGEAARRKAATAANKHGLSKKLARKQGKKSSRE